ncbi:hypothetical protein NODU109028_15685 [Nocardioides dubius]
MHQADRGVEMADAEPEVEESGDTAVTTEDAETTVDEKRVSAEAAASTETTDSESRSLLPGWVPWALLAAGLVVLVLGVQFWRSAEPDPDAARAERRDAVVVAATSNLETLQTMDYEKAEEHLAAWQEVSIGVLGDQFAELTAEDRQAIVDAQAKSTGRVLSLAVTELGERTATVIAAIETEVVTAADPDAEPVKKRNRFGADLVLVNGRWLVENLSQVGVNLK